MSNFKYRNSRFLIIFFSLLFSISGSAMKRAYEPEDNEDVSSSSKRFHALILPELPNEMWAKIFGHLDFPTSLKILSVNKYWHEKNWLDAKTKEAQQVAYERKDFALFKVLILKARSIPAENIFLESLLRSVKESNVDSFKHKFAISSALVERQKTDAFDVIVFFAVNHNSWQGTSGYEIENRCRAISLLNLIVNQKYCDAYEDAEDYLSETHKKVFEDENDTNSEDSDYDSKEDLFRACNQLVQALLENNYEPTDFDFDNFSYEP